MTLDTRVYVLDPVPRDQVFRKCQQIIANYDTEGRAPEAQRWRDDHEWGDHHVLMNEGMQGLPGWLIVHYRPDGPYRTEQQAQQCDYCEPGCDGSTHPPACWLEVSIDTAYGYRGPNDMNCGSLHARFVAELGMWLDSLLVSWCDVHDALEGTCKPDPASGAAGVPCAASPQRNPRGEGVRWRWLNEYTGEIHAGYDKLPALVGSSDQATAWFEREVKPAIAAHVMAAIEKGDR
jgi:hypothetical protein